MELTKLIKIREVFGHWMDFRWQNWGFIFFIAVDGVTTVCRLVCEKIDASLGTTYTGAGTLNVSY